MLLQHEVVVDGGMDNLTLANMATNAATLADRFPHIRAQLDGIRDLRESMRDINARSDFERKCGQGSVGKEVAAIPIEVWAMMEAACPAAAWDKKLFYKWLSDNPEYKV
jgi:hypothetical protein